MPTTNSTAPAPRYALYATHDLLGGRYASGPLDLDNALTAREAYGKAKASGRYGIRHIPTGATWAGLCGGPDLWLDQEGFEVAHGLDHYDEQSSPSSLASVYSVEPPAYGPDLQADDLLAEEERELRQALGAPNDGEAPRWTLAPGRTLCYDGKPLCYLAAASGADEVTGPARTSAPWELDDLAHVVVQLLESSLFRRLQGSEPIPSPIPGALAEWARGGHRSADHEPDPPDRR